MITSMSQCLDIDAIEDLMMSVPTVVCVLKLLCAIGEWGLEGINLHGKFYYQGSVQQIGSIVCMMLHVINGFSGVQ